MIKFHLRFIVGYNANELSNSVGHCKVVSWLVDNRKTITYEDYTNKCGSYGLYHTSELIFNEWKQAKYAY